MTRLLLTATAAVVLIGAVPAHASPATYQDGWNARAFWEGWFNGISNREAYRDGASWWSTHRNDPGGASCASMPRPSAVTRTTGNDLSAGEGCSMAKFQLDGSDARRKADPDFRRGWNEWVNTAPAPPAARGAHVIEVALAGVRERRVLVNLNSVWGYSFVLDTGATGCQIPQNVVDDLLARGMLSNSSFAGIGRATLADGREVTQGVYRINLGIGSGIEGVHLDGMKCGVSPAGTDGLLGMDFLGKFDSFLIDNARSKLILRWTV